MIDREIKLDFTNLDVLFNGEYLPLVDKILEAKAQSSIVITLSHFLFIEMGELYNSSK